MEIKTKFNVGDKAYTLLNNVICQVKIDSVDVFKNEHYCFISYKVKVSDDCDGNITLSDKISENDLFTTISNLLESLKDKVVEYNDKWDKEIPF